MANMVCGGAMLSCSFGAAPSMLLVTPENKVTTTQPVATIMDYVVFKNIMPFGMCSSLANPSVAAATAAKLGVMTPMPCIPMPAGTWLPGSAKVMVANKPALTSNCKLMCAYGGVIQINSPGTFTISTS
ncbi:MAG: DUF4280 domain-containing protein [Lachnospiraceae bacterium]|nr:DUF4280 domain-containing protein [Lachnospiraceae bacterium]